MTLWLIGLGLRWTHHLWKGSEELFDWWNERMWTPAVIKHNKKMELKWKEEAK